MPALIQIDQVGSGVGVPGVARNDLWKGQPITLTDVGGNTAWRWTLVERPVGSLAELTSTSASSTSFTPDLSGEYRVRLVINTSGVTSHVTLRVRNDNLGEPEKPGWRLPGLAEIWNLDEFPITVSFPPSGHITASTVTGAIQELDLEKGGLALNNAWTGNNTWTAPTGSTFNGNVTFTAGDDFVCEASAFFESVVNFSEDVTFASNAAIAGTLIVSQASVLGDFGATFSSIEIVSGLSMQPGGSASLDGEISISGSFLDVSCPSTQVAPATTQETLADSAGVTLGLNIFESRVTALTTANRTYLLPVPQILGQRRRFVRPRTADGFTATLQTPGGIVMGTIPAMSQGWIEVVAKGLTAESWVVSAWGGAAASISNLV